MCLINELARFNKVQHQYCLTDEQGPAHKKTFFVKLKLGTEEFAASGSSIKKAQHAAASTALEQTKYPHPVPKQKHLLSASMSTPKDAGNTSITPTVELNALAMKRGELAVYRPIERKAAPVSPYYMHASYDFRGGYSNQRYRYPKPPRRFFVALKVGEREFVGDGETMQAARHNAASTALKVLRGLPLPTSSTSTRTELSAEVKTAEGVTSETSAPANTEILKSEISLVHEIALKRNMAVEFENVKESGPPHMRTFVTRCKCGTLVTEGDGSSKKLSKKHAAEKMVVELKKLPPLPPPPPTNKPKKTFTKPKQSKNLIKNVTGTCTVGLNPISRLIQIQQAKKEKEPTFSLIAEKGLPRCREFEVQVTVGEVVCTGVGPNKKLAKRHAAEQMLQSLGYSLAPPPPSKPTLKPAADAAAAASAAPGSPSATSSDKKVTFVDQESNHARLSVPGVIVVPSLARGNLTNPPTDSESAVEKKTTKGSSNAAAHCQMVPPDAVSTGCSVCPMDQLMYLAKVMGFEVQVTNIPKDNTRSEYLTVVTLCTNPPQFYNGSGSSVQASNDTAALGAIRKLSEVGLDGSSGQAQPGPSGDSYVKHSPRTKAERSPISATVSVKKEIK